MTLVGFMDGSKSVQYYDAVSRLIKVSRNVAFNENDEPKELEDFVKILGLQAKGENYSKGTPSQTKSETQPTMAKIIPKDPTTPGGSGSIICSEAWHCLCNLSCLGEGHENVLLC